jgi:hypothetical protein
VRFWTDCSIDQDRELNGIGRERPVFVTTSRPTTEPAALPGSGLIDVNYF